MARPHVNSAALIAPLCAFLIQGSWAVYANHHHGIEKALLAGAVQGVCSFGMTFLITLLMEFILLWSMNAASGVRLVGVVVPTVLILLSVLTFIHWFAGTPEIFLSIAPALIIGGIYCVVYGVGRIFLGRSRSGFMGNG